MAGAQWTGEDDRNLRRELRARALRRLVPYSRRSVVWTAAAPAALGRELFADSAAQIEPFFAE